jgi:hypothetical protein
MVVTEPEEALETRKAAFTARSESMRLAPDIAELVTGANTASPSSLGDILAATAQLQTLGPEVRSARSRNSAGLALRSGAGRQYRLAMAR